MPVGIDTWSPCWYVRDNSSAAKAMEALATVKMRRSTWLEEPIEGHRVGWFPASLMIAAEGHPAADGGLAGADDLAPALERLIASMEDRGIFPPNRKMAPLKNVRGEVLPVVGGTGFGGIRRWDATVDLQRTSAVGLAILRGAAAAEPPTFAQSVVHRGAGTTRPETIAWKGKRGLVCRIYDKGVEMGTANVGERIRFEDQRRFEKGARMAVEAAQSGLPAMMLRHRFEPLRRATKGVVVTTQAGAIERLQEKVEQGDLKPGMAQKLLGHLLFEREGISLGSRTTRYRSRKLAQEVGLVIGDQDEDVEIDLGAELTEVFD